MISLHVDYNINVLDVELKLDRIKGLRGRNSRTSGHLSRWCGQQVLHATYHRLNGLGLVLYDNLNISVEKIWACD